MVLFVWRVAGAAGASRAPETYERGNNGLGIYVQGGDASKKESVVQKEVKVAERQKATRADWRRRGSETRRCATVASMRK